MTDLYDAITTDNVIEVLDLLANGADANIRLVDKDSDGELTTPLCVAAGCDNVDIVRILLDSGAQIDDRDQTAKTACSVAAKKGHIDVLQLLIARGADLTVVDSDGEQPLTNAVYSDHEACAVALIAAGAPLAENDNVCCWAAARAAQLSRR